MAAGRTSEPRTASVTTTTSSTTITGTAGTFAGEDAGRPIVAAGIPADATIASVESDTSATLSAAATASATVSAQIVGDGAQTYGFTGWSPETDAESETYTVAAVNAGTATPSTLADSTTAVQQRARS